MPAMKDSFLTRSDRYVLPDFPITSYQLMEVKEYRQGLGDFMSRDDVLNLKIVKKKKLRNAISMNPALKYCDITLIKL